MEVIVLTVVSVIGAPCGQACRVSLSDMILTASLFPEFPAGRGRGPLDEENSRW